MVERRFEISPPIVDTLKNETTAPVGSNEVVPGINLSYEDAKRKGFGSISLRAFDVSTEFPADCVGDNVPMDEFND